MAYGYLLLILDSKQVDLIKNWALMYMSSDQETEKDN